MSAERNVRPLTVRKASAEANISRVVKAHEAPAPEFADLEKERAHLEEKLVCKQTETIACVGKWKRPQRSRKPFKAHCDGSQWT